MGHVMAVWGGIQTGGNMRFSAATMATFELPSNIEARSQIPSWGGFDKSPSSKFDGLLVLNSKNRCICALCHVCVIFFRIVCVQERTRVPRQICVGMNDHVL